MWDNSGGSYYSSVSHHDLWLSEGGIVARSVDIGKPPPNPVLEVDFGNVLAENNERLVLTENHILVSDVDTILNDGNIDASKITLRVSGVLGGTLQKLSSAAPPVWENIPLVAGQAYYAFTLAEVRAGKIAFLAGDGLASGEGEKITFQIQAADAGIPNDPTSLPHLSDSDPDTSDLEPVNAEISIVASTKLTAGRGGLVNEDGNLTPDETVLTDWMGSATTHGRALHVVVKLLGKLDGDALSLRGNYDKSKIEAVWKDGTDGTAELSLKVLSGATEADIRTALGMLWLDTSASLSASVRRVWVYPTLPGLSNVLYRMDESAGLMRYYFYDSTNQRFSAATTAASGRSLFGKSGYLGVYTSNAERDVYKNLMTSQMHLAITDVSTEGKWVITAGPRQDQVLWDHTLSPKAFGPGADGSNWNAQTDFWGFRQPDNRNDEDYAKILSEYSMLARDDDDGSRNSISHHDLWLSEGEIFFQRVSVATPPLNPILEVDFSRTQVDSGQRLVLTENHILVKDVDTVLSDGTVDASKITLRVSGLGGGTLELLSSGSWDAMTKAEVGGAPQSYYAFTLADVRDGKIAFVAGDGVASGDGGGGVKITFQIQAEDDDDNLSDSDPDTPDMDPVDGEISIVVPVEATTGYGALVNGDEVLSPDAGTLIDWKRSAESHGGKMRVVARIVDWKEGDELSLEGYVESKVTSGWDDGKKELSLELAVGATVQDMREALRTLWLDTDPLDAASTREIWVFPTVAGVNDFARRVDKSEKMVRYYFYDGTSRTFSAASTEASGRSLFGEEGYLGVYLSDAERAVYVGIRRGNIHLAVSDATTEGTWVIMSGPRTGEVLWEHSTQKYGSGARGSGWGTLDEFWDDGTTITGSHDYAELDSGRTTATSGNDGSRHSITHFDLLLSKGAFLSRGVNLLKSPPNPVLEVDFSSLLGTAGRTLMLHADHVLVKDPDTRDAVDDTKLDADKIKFRIAGISDGTLRTRTGGTWNAIVSKGTVGSEYQEFTLRQLRDGQVFFLLDEDATALVFTIQAADDGGNLSDSSFGDNNPDPINVSVPVVSLKEITAGKEMPVNDHGGLTPEDGTLRAWIAAATNDELVVLVRLEGAGSGDALFLEDGHGVATITPLWSWDEDTAIGTLSLRSAGSATPAEFQTVLSKLALRTARFATARDATISLRPDVVSEVEKQDYYTRIVLLGASGPRPYIGEQQFFMLNFGKDDRAILPPYKFLVEDFDSSAEQITMVMSELSAGATLYESDGSGGYDLVPAESDGSLEFTLKELQEGSMAIHLASPLGKEVSFKLKAKDEADNWNDIDTSNANTEDAREFAFNAVLELAPEKLDVDLETGYQKAVPFGGLEEKIKEVRSASSSLTGALHIVLEHGVSGDRLVMHGSVTGITGAWSDGGHRYILTVSDGTTTNAQIDEALAQIQYRASESVGEKERRLVVSWVDDTDTPKLLFSVRLANRPPVLRNWGVAARYHDITPAPGGSEAPLDLGYHPYREYMPEILDNEGEVVRLEVVLMDKAGGLLSADERVFLSRQLQDEAEAEGLAVRVLHSSDGKAYALEIKVGGVPVSPEFMSRILQGLMYRHGAAGRDGDVGERREISVAVFDGQAYAQVHTMEVRLVDTLPNPAGYVNTFIGTAKQSGMGVSQGTGNRDNEAGMTFPGAAYPFGAVRLTPETGQSHAYGGYRHDKGLWKMQFVVTAVSGPGCFAAEGGDFSVGVGGGRTKNANKDSQESEAGYYKVLLDGADSREVVLEAAASSPRTATMRLNYESAGLTGLVSIPGSAQLSEQNDRWVVMYNTSEDGVCRSSDPAFYVAMHIGKHQVSAVTKTEKMVPVTKTVSRLESWIDFTLKNSHQAVDIKISMSYVSRESASRNIDVENPEWTDFEVEKEKAKKAWNYYLSKVAIDEFQDVDHDKTDPLDKWSIFYSALYRSLLHMNAASDVDGNYSGIGEVSKNVREAPTYGYEAGAGTEGPPPKVYFYNFSGWDVYRSQMALVGLMAPALSHDMAITLLESAYVNGTATHDHDREIPRWTLGNVEAGIMPGDSGPASVSSLFMFGSRSVSLTSMLEVFDLSSRHARSGKTHAHHILEGAASDTAIAQMALWMSQQDSLPQAVREKARSLYEYARKRTNRAFNLLDPHGYARAQSSGFHNRDKSTHSTNFAEGNAIQYTFMILHDVFGLKQKIDAGEASDTVFEREHISDPFGGFVQAYSDLFKLSQNEGLRRWDAGERSMAIRFLMHFLKPNEGDSSWYAFMGNEVAHSSPFLANWFEPHLTQNATRRVALFGFRNTPGGLYGNDDLGATSAWYVWTAMGIYPVIPGVGGVTLVAPMFKSVEISVPGGKSVKLRSSSGTAQDAYIQSVRRDGRETSSVWLTAEELSRGVELDFQVGASESDWGEDDSDRPPSYGETEFDLPPDYSSIWLDEGDDSTGGSSHSAFDGSRNTAWRFISEPDGSKVLEVEFTSVYAASGLLLRHADVGRTSTLNSDLSNVMVSVAVKGSDGNWSDVAVTKTASWIDVETSTTVHDTRRMLLDFDAGEKEIHGLRLTFGGLDVNEEHGIYEVLAKDGSVEKAARLRSRRGVLEKSLGDDVSWIQLSADPVLSVGGLHQIGFR